MSDLAVRIIVGAVAAAGIAVAARRAGSLTTTGGVAAACIGTAAAAAGWAWAALLIAYFVSSSLLSRLGRARKLERTAGMVEKPGARDARQVLANGLPFAVLAVLTVLYDDEMALLMAAAAASLAASAADTWATEIGTWVGHAPRSVLTGRRLAVGQSGGITAPGCLGSIGGAAFLAAVAGSLGWPGRVLTTIVAAGLVGSLADSFAGAVLQARYWCDACRATTEMRVHDCGKATRPAGGLCFVDNDLVNLFATGLAAVFALLLLPGLPD